MLNTMPEGPPKVALPLNESLYLLHPYNATLITTKTPDGQNNVATIAWIIPTSVNPPLITMSIRKSRFTYPIIQETGEFVVNIPTFDMAEMYPGDVLTTKAGGGAGWGDPLNRDVEKVREDVRDELLSVQRARDVYGVVIKQESLGKDPWNIEVDYKATEELRKKLKAKK